MICHLESFRLTLTALSPLFIGSGAELSKKEFIYNKTCKKAFVLDFPKLYACLNRRGLLDAFEGYMTDYRDKDLRDWLMKNGVQENEFAKFISYEVETGEAFGPTDNTVAFKQFIRDPYGLPYIPGSSLKGALRTALLSEMLKKDERTASKTTEQLMRLVPNLTSPDNTTKRYAMKDFERTAKSIEDEKINTLKFTKRGNPPDKGDMVNSVMRGIQISDSAPLDNTCLVLATKMDLGKSGQFKSLNLCRESLKPGTKVFFTVTLDKSVLKGSGIDKAFILAAARDFAAVQRKQYEKFTLPSTADNTPCEDGAELFLGGGAGFLSKTLLYSLAPDDATGVKLTAAVLENKFRNHYHGKDVAKGVSPSKLKMTKYDGKYYLFGRCAVSFE